MKHIPNIEQAMQSGVICRDGFLGTDPRPLSAILQEDAQAVRRHGLTHAQIARQMASLRDAGRQGIEDWVSVPPHFEVRVESIRGRLPCPYGDSDAVPKTRITVRNGRMNRQITYTDLLIHLVGQHGFYEGRGSAFRLEPDDLIETLEIQPAS